MFCSVGKGSHSTGFDVLVIAECSARAGLNAAALLITLAWLLVWLLLPLAGLLLPTAALLPTLAAPDNGASFLFPGMRPGLDHELLDQAQVMVAVSAVLTAACLN